MKRQGGKTWVEINPMSSSHKIKVEAETEEEEKTEDAEAEDFKTAGNRKKVRAGRSSSVTIVAKRGT